MRVKSQYSLSALSLLVLVQAFFIRQDQFVASFIFLSAGFGFYLLAGNSLLQDEPFLKRLNLILKIALLFAFPRGSDDLYRFFWDGQLLIQGYHPYGFRPDQVTGQLQPFLDSIYKHLNSPGYYSVYPPLLQALFGLCALASFKSVFLFSILWKSILLLADQWFLRYLEKLASLNSGLAFWYMWNPLVLIEIAGNGHPEGLMIPALILSFYLLRNHRMALSASALALAAGIKLFPIALLPLFARHLGLRKAIPYAFLAAMVFLVFMLPVWPYGDHFLSSVKLYFQKFEFNGSIYEIWKAIEFRRHGHNNIFFIGKVIPVIFIAFTGLIVLIQKQNHFQSLLKSSLLVWTGYLFLSTTVHPWYALPLIPLGLLSGFIFPLAWSGAIFLSYSWYDPDLGLGWKYACTAVEYAILAGAVIYDLLKIKKS